MDILTDVCSSMKRGKDGSIPFKRIEKMIKAWKKNKASTDQIKLLDDVGIN